MYVQVAVALLVASETRWWDKLTLQNDASHLTRPVGISAHSDWPSKVSLSKSVGARR